MRIISVGGVFVTISAMIQLRSVTGSHTHARALVWGYVFRNS